MALTDSDAFPGINATEPQKASGFVLPQAALTRLPHLHSETVRAAHLNRFLGHAIQAVWLLIAAGAVTFVWGGGRTLPENFAWGLLLLIGALAMTRTYMRAFALKRGPVESLASDLRACLLYAGFAWGAGAFLALPTGAGTIALVLFAAGPSALMALVLRDRTGILLFAAPVAALCASAALLDYAGGPASAAAILLAQGIVVAVTMLMKNTGPDAQAAGLSLR